MNTDLFINNDWCAAASGERFDVINPATEDVVAQVAKGNADDVDAAVDAARACFESDAWQQMNVRDRGRLLDRAGDLLKERLPDVARLETLQNG